jgi:hypothetical protein
MVLQRLGCGYCRVLWRSGAPRPMKMGTIRSPFHYDDGARHAFQLVKLRLPTTLRYASRAAAFMIWQYVSVPSIAAMSASTWVP